MIGFGEIQKIAMYKRLEEEAVMTFFGFDGERLASIEFNPTLVARAFELSKEKTFIMEGFEETSLSIVLETDHQKERYESLLHTLHNGKIKEIWQIDISS